MKDAKRHRLNNAVRQSRKPLNAGIMENHQPNPRYDLQSIA